MNPTLWDQLERAIALATTAHFSQRDKAGLPYILHLIRVMQSVADPIEKQAAILHDYLEDTLGSLETLKEHSINEQAIAAIQLLTRPETSSYCDYVVALADNPIARAVKLADIEDNYRIGRVAYRSEHTGEDSLRIQRYALSHQFLRQEISSLEYTQRMEGLDDLQPIDLQK